jgi:hypothetical protein
MVFRDYSQGAFRMRGIGKGQQLTVFIIPEIMELISSTLKASAGYKMAPTSEKKRGVSYNDQQSLTDVCAWLVLNSFKTEKVQFSTLMEQSVHNVWRKVAFQTLLTEGAEIGTQKASAVAIASVDVYRTRIDHAVENGKIVLSAVALK